MTKKNYIQIAKLIRRTVELERTKQLDEPVRFITHHLANYFKEDNPRFNYQRFYEACGLIE